MFFRVTPRFYISSDGILSLDGWKLICFDRPKDIKQGAVSIYYREPLLAKTILINYLPEHLVCEVNYENIKIFVTFYQSPSQTDGEFVEFLCSFKSVINNINQPNLYFVITVHFFVLFLYYSFQQLPGKDNNTLKGIKIENLTASYSLMQLISEPTHLLSTLLQVHALILYLLIILIWLWIVLFSLLLHQNCHHQTFFGKIHLNIFYPPPYTWCKWDYDRANEKAVYNAIANFD